jgi:hypothetical protein
MASSTDGFRNKLHEISNTQSVFVDLGGAIGLPREELLRLFKSQEEATLSSAAMGNAAQDAGDKI